MNYFGIVKAALSGGIKGHFGQWAEDALVRKLFPGSLKRGVYMDIGAYHPFVHSNTAFFWLSGWRGINIDANPNSIALFKRVRPGDLNVWKAIIPDAQFQSGQTSVRLHLPKLPDLKSGISATGTVSRALDPGDGRTLEVPAQSIGALIEEQSITGIDYLNIDIEGHDLAILCELDLEKLGPQVVSIEDFCQDFADPGRSDIASEMKNRGYTLMGRAGPTSIFVRTGS